MLLLLCLCLRYGQLSLLAGASPRTSPCLLAAQATTRRPLEPPQHLASRGRQPPTRRHLESSRASQGSSLPPLEPTHRLQGSSSSPRRRQAGRQVPMRRPRPTRSRPTRHRPSSRCEHVVHCCQQQGFDSALGEFYPHFTVSFCCCRHGLILLPPTHPPLLQPTASAPFPKPRCRATMVPRPLAGRAALRLQAQAAHHRLLAPMVAPMAAMVRPQGAHPGPTVHTLRPPEGRRRLGSQRSSRRRPSGGLLRPRRAGRRHSRCEPLNQSLTY